MSPSRSPTMVIISASARQPRPSRYQEVSDGIPCRPRCVSGFCCSFATPTWSGRRRGMTKRRQAVQVSRDQSFKGRQFTAEVILWAIRWYLMFPISYRDLELMLLDRGVEVDHTTTFRWIQAYAVELEKQIRPHLRMSNGSWRVDETYVKVKGRWMYLYRAVDSCGQTDRLSTVGQARC
jgi:DDE domain